jgi:hypothetical protein
MLLAYIEDKPGARLCFSDLMAVLNTNDPMRVLSATVILTSGPMPLMTPYFQVKSADGAMHDVKTLPKSSADGDRLFILEATGEVIPNVSECAYIAFEVTEFH